MRVLVTGASGFIGANLARRLVRDGHETHLLLRPEHRGWRLRGIADEVTSHDVNLADREGVLDAVRSVRPEWVFHLAAYGAYSSQTGFEQMVATNLLGASNLIDACADFGVERLVQAGSSSEYGYRDHAPREDEVIEPNSHYAVTKAAAANYASFVARERGLHAVTLRFYSVYGPYEDPGRLIPALLSHAAKGTLPPLVAPETARDFVYVEDAVDALLAAAGPRSKAGEIYNIASGVQTTLAELVTLVKTMFRVLEEPVWATMPQRAWDTDCWVGNPAKAARELDWRAETTLKTGLQRTAEQLRYTI